MYVDEIDALNLSYRASLYSLVPAREPGIEMRASGPRPSSPPYIRIYIKSDCSIGRSDKTGFVTRSFYFDMFFN